MTPKDDDPLLPEPAKYGLVAAATIVSLGWLAPVWLARWSSAAAARQIAEGTRGANSFPHEAFAVDMSRLAWRWLMVSIAFWAVVGVVTVWRLRRRTPAVNNPGS